MKNKVTKHVSWLCWTLVVHDFFIALVLNQWYKHNWSSSLISFINMQIAFYVYTCRYDLKWLFVRLIYRLFFCIIVDLQWLITVTMAASWMGLCTHSVYRMLLTQWYKHNWSSKWMPFVHSVECICSNTFLN